MFLLFCLIIFISFFTFIFGKIFIDSSKKLELCQTIRKEGPKTHYKKIGTPSMGGVIFIFPIFLISLFYLKYTLIPITSMLLYSFLGVYDDLNKRKIKKGKGLSIKKKLFFQFLISFIISFFIFLFNFKNFKLGFTNNLFINFNNIFFFIFLIFYFVGITNAVNFTDGLDGMLIFVTLPILTIFFLISLLQKKYIFCNFLILIFIILVIFLLFNIHPAKVFMGDTGSMGLGGLLCGISIILNLELLMFILGIIYLIEIISVVLQIIFFKFTNGKRLFKMAPIHHHLELSGLKETKIVFIFTTISLFFSIVSFILYWLC